MAEDLKLKIINGYQALYLLNKTIKTQISMAMDEHTKDLKQSRDTWEDIAQNCRKDLEVQVECIVELRESNKILSQRFDEVFNALKLLYKETETLKTHIVEQNLIDWEDESIEGCKDLDRALKTAQEYVFNRA